MAYVEIDLGEFEDDELISELECRGYDVSERPIKSDAHSLYRSWQQDSPDTFEKNLKQFFKEHLDLVSI